MESAEEQNTIWSEDQYCMMKSEFSELYSEEMRGNIRSNLIGIAVDELSQNVQATLPSDPF